MKRFTLFAILLPVLFACQRRDESTSTTPTPPPATQTAPEPAPVTPTTPEPAPATPATPEPTPPVTATEPSQPAPQASAPTEPATPATPATPPATPATTKSSGSSGSADEYTVAKGDTLSGIAREHGMNYQDLATWNNLQDPNQIRPGQTLRLTEPSS